jgi:membrane-associated phospholipid phosphatase
MRRLFLSIVFLSLGSFLFSQNWDIRLLKEINFGRNKHFDQVFILASDMVSPVSITLPLVFIGSGYYQNDRVMLIRGMEQGSSAIAATLLSMLLKYSIDRPRPFDTYSDLDARIHPKSPSFPSGHTCSAFATATTLCFLYPKWYVIVPSSIYACMIGYSRLDLGVHYPTDVIAGAILGSLSSVGVHILYKKLLSNGNYLNRHYEDIHGAQ